MLNFKDNGKTKLVVVAGPTAVGKSHYAVKLAHEIGGEIISADSMQVYKYMDIGTAKITVDDMEGIPHHLIDFKLPDEEYDIAAFQKDAIKCIGDVTSRGKIPIICGGTGFYIQAVTKNIDFSPIPDDEDYKCKYENILIQSGIDGPDILHKMLDKVDPEYAAQVHANNTRRVINALAFYDRTGTKLSDHNKNEFLKESPYDLKYLVLNKDRDVVYEKINRRVDLMIKEGFLEEVIRLRDMGYGPTLKPMQGLGYKELNAYIDGQLTFNEAIEQIKLNTRHFAKRQLTWFKREADAVWIQR